MFLADAVRPKQHPQTERSNEREVENNAGGFVYAVDAWARLDRFILLGTAGGTYYVGQDAHTEDSIKVVRACLAEDGARAIARVVEISDGGRAAKQDYGLLVLALATATKLNPAPAGAVTAAEHDRVTGMAARRAAYAAIPKVCRTASTLFQFLAYHEAAGGGWSRGLRSAVAGWYNERPIDQLAYQLVKYAQRHGFTHRDVFRLAHPNVGDARPLDDVKARAALYGWVVGQEIDEALAPEIIRNVTAVRFAGEIPPARKVELARALPREALPTAWLTDPSVWEALLYGETDGAGMPLTALIRNLATMTKLGLVSAGSAATTYIVSELVNADRIRKARVHPMALFLAMKTYVLGHGVRGSATWGPVNAIVEALDAAFYLAFPNVTPTGKRIVVAIDASGSMGSPVLGYENISAREAAIAFALVTVRTEPHARLIGFTDGGASAGHSQSLHWQQHGYRRGDTVEFPVGGDERMRDLQTRFEKNLSAHGTDCAIPFLWSSAAVANAQPDAVVTFTDSETWAGKTKVVDALAALRRETGKPVKAITAATTATAYDIVDPTDPLALGIAGFDAAVPELITEFIR